MANKTFQQSKSQPIRVIMKDAVNSQPLLTWICINAIGNVAGKYKLTIQHSFFGQI